MQKGIKTPSVSQRSSSNFPDDPTAEMQKGIKTYKNLGYSQFFLYRHDPTAEMQKGIKTLFLQEGVFPLLLRYDPTAEMQKGIKTLVSLFLGSQ